MRRPEPTHTHTHHERDDHDEHEGALGSSRELDALEPEPPSDEDEESGVPDPTFPPPHPPTTPMQDADDAQPSRLVDHLIELRSRLLRAVAGPDGRVPVPDALRVRALQPLAAPLISKLPQAASMIAVDPAGGFFVPVKLTFFAALFITAPWLLYQAWAFVAPGLYKREKRLATPLLVSAGRAVLLGLRVRVFPRAADGVRLPDQIHARSRADDAGPRKYVDFVLVIFLAFGASFELPVALVILVLLGWVTPKQLREWRGYAVVGIFVVAAVITPPDVVSQLMLAIPMMVLYEAGIFFSRFVVPRKPEPEKPEPASGD
jgi:sec-independent protein translocase protein TatC